jgi:hypothetical protein
LLVLAAGSGFAQLQAERFPARSEPLAGTPVELRIQDGVTARERQAVGGGVRRSHRYLRSGLGRTVRGPVEARIAHEDHCGGSDGGDALIGEGRAGLLCVDTTNLYWRWLISNDVVAATALSAHEYVHVLQAELGCLPGGDGRDYRWIVEGMADHLGWRALVWSGRTTDARVRRTIRRDEPFSNPRLLREFEQAGGRTQQYALWHLAIRRLLDEAVKAGAVARARPEVALIRFCERVGAGGTWRASFIRSFGISAYDFYARFEESRPRDG